MESAKQKSKFAHIMKLLVRSKTGLVGLLIILAVLVCAIFGPMIAPYDPAAISPMEMLLPPGSSGHLLGTDNLGRDMLSRIICGTRVSLLVGILSVVVSGLVGMMLGLLAGYYGGILDSCIMRLADAFHAIPKILFGMVVLAILDPSVFNLILVIGLTSWVTFARLIRGEVLGIKQKEYVKASVSIGTSNLVIILKHILPNVLSSFVVLCTTSVAGSIITEAGLSFLGLGIQPPTISWGYMLSDGRNYLATEPWLATFPGLAITITVLGIMFFGNWLRDVLDPHNQGIQ